jgi:hypothetical protein
MSDKSRSWRGNDFGESHRLGGIKLEIAASPPLRSERWGRNKKKTVKRHSNPELLNCEARHPANESPLFLPRQTGRATEQVALLSKSVVDSAKTEPQAKASVFSPFVAAMVSLCKQNEGARKKMQFSQESVRRPSPSLETNKPGSRAFPQYTGSRAPPTVRFSSSLPSPEPTSIQETNTS